MAEKTSEDYTNDGNIKTQMEMDFESPAAVVSLICDSETSGDKLVDILTTLRQTLKSSSKRY